MTRVERLLESLFSNEEQYYETVSTIIDYRSYQNFRTRWNQNSFSDVLPEILSDPTRSPLILGPPHTLLKPG